MQARPAGQPNAIRGKVIRGGRWFLRKPRLRTERGAMDFAPQQLDLAEVALYLAVVLAPIYRGGLRVLGIGESMTAVIVLSS